MAKNKKAAAPPCLHCNVVFPVDMRWCTRCESHLGIDSWHGGKEHCGRCVSGENDDYIERKKGREERIAQALLDAKDPKNWCDCGAVEAFEKWVNSPEYPRRFDNRGTTP